VIVETRGLSRRFGAHEAVAGLDITVYEGDLYGFLGPNGSGKTTTIRMLLGLIPKSAGEIRIFGKPLEANRLEIARSVGALVEEPAFYPYLTGRDNLRVMGLLAGGVPDARVEECLALVGLSARGGDKVSVYSQGMRQRLGIAQAMLARPKLLFLDEPTNGLDPPGIEEMRKLLLRLTSEERVTVFVSSHLLHEVELLCNRVAILRKGRKVVEGETARLLETDTVRLELGVEGPLEPAEAALAALALPKGARTDDGKRLVLPCPRERVASVARGLMERGIDVTALIPRRPTLEEYFRERLVASEAAA